MESFTEFRRLFKIQSNIKNKKEKILFSTRRISNYKKENNLISNCPIANYSTKHFNINKKDFTNQHKNNYFKTINTVFSNGIKYDKSQKNLNISNRNSKIHKSYQILNNYSILKDKISTNITTDSTVNLTENYSYSKNLNTIKINKNLDTLKERCFKLLTKYNKILDGIGNKVNK